MSPSRYMTVSQRESAELPVKAWPDTRLAWSPSGAAAVPRYKNTYQTDDARVAQRRRVGSVYLLATVYNRPRRYHDGRYPRHANKAKSVRYDPEWKLCPDAGSWAADIPSRCLRIAVPGTSTTATTINNNNNSNKVSFLNVTTRARTNQRSSKIVVNRVRWPKRCRQTSATTESHRYDRSKKVCHRSDRDGTGLRRTRRDDELTRSQQTLADEETTNILRTISVALLAPANMVISNFHIEFDNNASFRPGQTITGQVIMDVWSRTELRHVEFSLRGEGTVRIFKNSFTFIERPKHEIYLNKRILLISPPDGAASVILNPGRYVSDFSYSLPNELPPSVHQFDMGNGYVFDISYSARANVCDAVGTRYIQPLHENYHKVIKSAKCNFQVLPLSDWKSLSGAQEPVHYTEQLLLLCSCTSQPTKVHVSIDRGVYPVGGNIKVRLKVINPTRKQSVKVIRANLEQRMTYKGDLIQKFRKTLISVEDDVQYGPQSDIRTGFDIPIPKTIVPSYLPHCNILDVTYTIKVTVRFKGVRGKLTVAVPVIITPTARDHLLTTRSHSGFNWHSIRQSSSEDEPGTAYTSSQDTDPAAHGNVTNGKNQPGQGQLIENQITTKYRTGLKCCPCCLLFCRFGIYNDEEG
ncbi:hypothetical protein LSH36_616g03033 [Paralvinella palmiformis]|uniref:Arrestin C-terminal-like domain-containing protein n=1 Tax=Paralvinella palmiformis TaxID=53620 RepID=A0AAD9MWD3_9ANNE|nr:hypothetical protein LSH36_616g03033 [Paralvinella palmiformis]